MVATTIELHSLRLLWLDEDIDEINNEKYRTFIEKFQKMFNYVNMFKDVNECIDFMNNNKEGNIVLISSGTLGQAVLPVVHDNPQINTIYMISKDNMQLEKWPIVKGVYTDISSIYDALKQAVEHHEQNSLSISVVSTSDGPLNRNLNELDQSFMYTQILKEILLTIDFDQGHINEFLNYCRKRFIENIYELNNVDKLEKEYRRHQSIWWSTYDCFLFSMLNYALRTMDVDLIIKMGFFVRDLHQHIARLHSEQYGEQNLSKSFIVYRGQGLSQTDFDTLMKTKDGLLSFNNFLSTSQIRDVSLEYAQRTIATSNLVGILFAITIDPSTPSIPFANIDDVSAHEKQGEILFSMHSIFRIGEIKQINGNTRLWQVDLTLTGDNDTGLNVLTEWMREETKGSTGWFRLGKLMVKLAEYDQAEALYNILPLQTADEKELGDIYYQLGYIMIGRNQYAKAISFYEKSLELRQKVLTSEHPDVAECYNDIGVIHSKMGDYLKARSFYEKALAIQQKTLPSNHPDLAACYNNIGMVYRNKGGYSKALIYYEKAYEIVRKTLPIHHPHLAIPYSNIGSVYEKMHEYSKALSYYQKALEIRQKALPLHHPDLAISYNTIGLVYDDMGEYGQALLYYEQALEIQQKTLSSNHPDLATSYNNIGLMYYYMGDYLKALSYYDHALDILHQSLPTNHPHIQDVKKSIEFVKIML